MFSKRFFSDLLRVLLPVITGAMAISYSPEIAQALGAAYLSLIGVQLGGCGIMLGLAHLFRRVFFPDFDLGKEMASAREQGHSWVNVLAVVMFVIALLAVGGPVKASTLPANFSTYRHVVDEARSELWPTGMSIATLYAQVHQETCISDKHSKCWSPFAELCMGPGCSDERGVGLCMITKTENMDALTALVAKHPKELAGWSWRDPALHSPRHQARALVLMNRDNASVAVGAATERDRDAMILAAYNGGPGRVRTDRRLCAGTKGCDPSRWYGNVEHTSTLAKAPSRYRVSFFQINRSYPKRIQDLHYPRYAAEVGA